jgi:hypothetical protein
MSDDVATQIAEAERRGERSLRTEPRARAARYDRRTGRIRVDLTTNAALLFRHARRRGWSGQATTSWRKSKSSASDSGCTGSSSMSI